MKRFIRTKLFRTLREASQKGIDMDAKVLNSRYDEFAALLFEECAATGRAACYNALVYTRVELSGLTAGGKNSRLFTQSHRTD